MTLAILTSLHDEWASFASTKLSLKTSFEWSDVPKLHIYLEDINLEVKGFP